MPGDVPIILHHIKIALFGDIIGAGDRRLDNPPIGRIQELEIAPIRGDFFLGRHSGAHEGRTRNPEIPGLVLADHPGMTAT
jgi:hypothetical protein